MTASTRYRKRPRLRERTTDGYRLILRAVLFFAMVSHTQDLASAMEQSSARLAAGKHCFAHEGSTLQLDILRDGSARFSVDAQESTGDWCSADGTARPFPGGWRFTDDFMAEHCQLDISVSKAGSITFSDKDWNCRIYYCGHRATFDAIQFSKADEARCE